jgi:hypothetical protein
MTPPVPTGTREQIQYIGPRLGDFGVVGKVSGVRYHVPGKNMLVEDAGGKVGVALADIPFLLGLNRGRDFRRLPPTLPVVAAPPPPPPEPEPEPEQEEPKIESKAPEVAWARPATGDIRGKAIVGRAVAAAQAQPPAPAPEPAPTPAQEPEPAAVEVENVKPKRRRQKHVAQSGA